MKHRTKSNGKYQFDRKTREQIWERDGGECIFCRLGYHMECTDPVLYGIKDIMHYIPKSKGGLGIPQNGAVGCRYHHGLLDNGSKGLRGEMLELFREYLESRCPDWDADVLVYKKWNFPKIG